MNIVDSTFCYHIINKIKEVGYNQLTAAELASVTSVAARKATNTNFILML